MKKLCIILIFLLLLTAIGCEDKNDASVQEVVPVVDVVRKAIPFDERKFIYNNGIEIEYKGVNKYENKVSEEHRYPVISGLKDKAVQEKINNELEATGKKLLSQLEADLRLMLKTEDLKISKKYTDAHITYNCNNVIFVEYVARCEYFTDNSINFSDYKFNSYGYDLNSGEKISLDDLFKPGADYKSKINNFICQYIIENNYDDFEYERMTKPFQGIRENQSFTFDIDGLKIILDEKNDEFVSFGYPEFINIPLKYLGDDLYIFDKYFDENVNICEKAKLIKKLLPNQLEFKAYNYTEEENEKYYIRITNGEFIDVPNKDIEKKLNEMVKTRLVVDDFKDKAMALKKADRIPRLLHDINIFANFGGYLSMAVSEDIYYDNGYEIIRKPFNYDFNLNKEMHIEDLFVDGTDISNVIKSYIKEVNHTLNEKIIDEGVESALKNNMFNFEENGLCIYISPEGAKLENYQEWVWIPYEEFGMENIKIFN